MVYTFAARARKAEIGLESQGEVSCRPKWMLTVEFCCVHLRHCLRPSGTRLRCLGLDLHLAAHLCPSVTTGWPWCCSP